MAALNLALIRERCSYPRPDYAPPAPAPGRYVCALEDRFGNQFGRLLCREAARPHAPWIDVFGQSLHVGEVLEGREFAVATVATLEAFTVFRIAAGRPPEPIFTCRGRVTLCALSPDGRFIALEAALDGDALRPSLLVLDEAGGIRAQLRGVDGIDGCWEARWSPRIGDDRLIVHHEASGTLQPALWHPDSGRIERLAIGLDGEVRGSWNATGDGILLRRALDGRSDLHRHDLGTGATACIQPRDGVIWQVDVHPDNAVTGVWTANHGWGQVFREGERRATPGFQPTRPLHRWVFERIAGVPCFIVGDPGAAGGPWTIFEGYGNPAYHLADAYNRKITSWVDHGFAVVLVNTRGCSGFGRAWREGNVGRVGVSELDDLARVRAALVARGQVHPRRTIVAGESWGGFMALLAMARQPDLWRIGIANVPVADWTRITEEASPITWALTRSIFSRGGHPTARELREASPLTYVDAVRGPIRMDVGSDDLKCPPAPNRRFAEALAARGVPCEFDVFSGGHGSPNREESIRQSAAGLGFLLKHTADFDARDR